MSFADLQMAFSIIESNPDSADFAGKKPEALIALAESTLGGRFPPTYRAFLDTYGCGDIAGNELYGVIHEDFESSGVPDAIWATLSHRRNSGLPERFVIVHATGFGPYDLIDLSRRNEFGESPIVTWLPNLSKDFDQLETVADDFGEYLLRLIESS